MWCATVKETLAAISGVAIALLPLASIGAPKYVGVEGCGCHKAEIAVWEVGPHAKAFESLRPGKRKTAKRKVGLDAQKDYTTDRKCLKCHSSQSGNKGSRAGVGGGGVVPGVDCEQCHGPGGDYRELHEKKRYGFMRDEAKAMGQIYGSEDPSVCERCHVDEHSPFNESVGDRYRFDWESELRDRLIYHVGIIEKDQ